MQQSIDHHSLRALDSNHADRRLVVDVENTEIWKTQDSPIRMRLLELIRRLGSCTILELAESAGTNPVNLYYHMRALEGAGLIEPVGHREGVARRAPVIYATTHEEIVIEFDPDDPEGLQRIEALQRNWQREASDNHSLTNASNSHGAEYAIRWEFLTRAEREEISELMGRIVGVLDRKRALKTTAASGDERMVVIGMQMAECCEGQLPTPRVNVQPVDRTRLAPRDLRDNRQSVAQTA